MTSRPAAPDLTRRETWPNTESETPETDAAQFFAGNINKSEFSTGEMVVRTDLARSLERRLSLAQSRLAEVELDAARYRWLKSNASGDGLYITRWKGGVPVGTLLDTADYKITDAAIDAELKPPSASSQS